LKTTVATQLYGLIEQLLKSQNDPWKCGNKFRFQRIFLPICQMVEILLEEINFATQKCKNNKFSLAAVT